MLQVGSAGEAFWIPKQESFLRIYINSFYAILSSCYKYDSSPPTQGGFHVRDGPLFFWRGDGKFLKKLFAKTKSANKLFAHIEKRKK
jgi:hypothetical protein